MTFPDARDGQSGDVDRTARSIKGGGPTQPSTLELRKGQVIAYDYSSGAMSITLGGGDTVIDSVQTLSNYRPLADDSCFVLVSGPDLIVLDRDASHGPSAVGYKHTRSIGATESRSSTSFGDLATYGPELETAISKSGWMMVQVSAQMYSNVDSDGGYMGIALSGSNSRSPDIDASLLVYLANANTSIHASRTFLMAGLDPGFTTVTAKYRSVFGGSAAFGFRTLWAMSL